MEVEVQVDMMEEDIGECLEEVSNYIRL